jgi:hypothetical protein
MTMETECVKHETPNGWAEEATVIHEGKRFTAGGAVVQPDHVIGYLKFPPNATKCVGACGELVSWSGEKIGTFVITSSWKTPRSYVSSRMFQVRAYIVGVGAFTGRSAGNGMIYKGKRTN